MKHQAISFNLNIGHIARQRPNRRTKRTPVHKPRSVMSEGGFLRQSLFRSPTRKTFFD